MCSNLRASAPTPSSRPRHPLRSSRPIALLTLALATGACAAGDPEAPPARPPSADRAILVSIDALSERILRETLTTEEAPALYRVFDQGMCAEHAVSHFPSVTAASHAVLWTGAWGNVHGVTSNTMPLLPRDQHTVLETTNGFHYSTLSAEPLWITAGKAGVPVAGHHVTQAPGVPGYAPIDGSRTPEQEARRAESARILALPNVNVMNGYNRIVERQRVVTGADVEWLEPQAAGWSGLETLEHAGSAFPLRAFRLELAEGGPLHGLVIAGDPTAPREAGESGESGESSRYPRVLLSLDAKVAGAVTARAAPLESESLDEGRELARRFSGALEVPVEGGRLYVQVRLFEVAADGRDFVLYQPPLHVVEGNRDDLMLAYDRGIGGWTGNSGFFAYRTGALGPKLTDGGDGTAEARYLETAEHLLRQFNLGSEWLWRTHEPRLLMDYFPLSDAIDHELLGYMDPDGPGFSAGQAAAVRDFRARVWRLVDRRVAHLEQMANEAGAALFVTGDHGMRASWNLFLPNLALLEAGLLFLDDEGSIDLSRTQAVSPNGYWITVNRTAYREGIVPPEEEARVVAAVRQALEGVRGADGGRVVTRTLTPETDPEFGIGGPTGGDVYWGTALGYRASSSIQGSGGPVRETTLTAGHGFAPDEPDMYTVFCALGGGFQAGRIPSVPTTVVAPTVAEWAGIPRPADAVGVSVLEAMLGRR
ncbi:hypothetical protein BH23GEM11_BH23GEM11_06360 [soil metagenome]